MQFKKKNRARQMVIKIIVNNKELTQLTDTSNGLNAYFTSIGENLVKDIDKHNHTQHLNSYNTYCTPSLKNSLFCTPVGRNELISISVS